MKITMDLENVFLQKTYLTTLYKLTKILICSEYKQSVFYRNCTNSKSSKLI